MRFRHKLSIVLVGLAIVPLAATAVLVATLLQHDQVNTVDGRLSVAVAAAAQSYSARLQEAKVAAQAVASQPDIARAFPPLHKPADLTTGVPSTMRVALWQGNKLLQGVVPRPPYWSATTFVGRVGGPRRVVVYVPLDSALLGSIANGIDVSQPVGLAFVANGSTVAAYPAAVPGAFPHLPVGSAGDATAAGTSVRAEGAKLPQLTGGPAYVAATYPSATLQNAINSQRLRILVPLIVLGVILIGGAVFAADRISRALTELAGRAAGLSRGRPGGDELSQLGAAIDEISSELTSRMGELEAERGRFKETLQRYGETLAATHDLKALVEAVLDTAVQATRARGGRLLLYDPESGEAVEQKRIGTARGSRTDLPIVVAAGDGLEGDALASHEHRVAQKPRGILAVPILREHNLLGLVTAVDPEEGAFSDDDVESLSALAVQAGVAIENARLHRVVERQAVTDALTGLANRRQFYEVLGREYERAQRFGQPVSLILLDIDDFKVINDSRGHLAGDAVLHSVAATLQEVIREIDLAARYGGEEFAVLLPQTGSEGAAMLAERLRSEIEARKIRFGTDEIEGVTASFGVAAGPGSQGTQIELIASADAALYQAKRVGKNHVTVAGAW